MDALVLPQEDPWGPTSAARAWPALQQPDLHPPHSTHDLVSGTPPQTSARYLLIQCSLVEHTAEMVTSCSPCAPWYVSSGWLLHTLAQAVQPINGKAARHVSNAVKGWNEESWLHYTEYFLKQLFQVQESQTERQPGNSICFHCFLNGDNVCLGTEQNSSVIWSFGTLASQ